MGTIAIYNVIFGIYIFDSNNIIYCQNIFNNSSNLFGCSGLKGKKYCILNKQYTQEEYEKLVPKIIEHMKETGEWGKHFPAKDSPFGFNETVAYEYFPLTKEQALKFGAKWKEEDKLNHYLGPKIVLPFDIKEVKEDITKQILTCENCNKNYRLILQEIDFYRKMSLPVPHMCPECRHNRRMSLRNHRKLYNRKCMKCGAEIKTTYSPDRPEKVYCEACYLKEVY
jgi:Zn ribbon nucleic-acid-binding protein